MSIQWIETKNIDDPMLRRALTGSGILVFNPALALGAGYFSRGRVKNGNPRRWFVVKTRWNTFRDRLYPKRIGVGFSAYDVEDALNKLNTDTRLKNRIATISYGADCFADDVTFWRI